MSGETAEKDLLGQTRPHYLLISKQNTNNKGVKKGNTGEMRDVKLERMPSLLERMPSLMERMPSLHDEVLARTYSVTRDELTPNCPEQTLGAGRLSWPQHDSRLSGEGTSSSSPAAPVPWSPTDGAQRVSSGSAGCPKLLRPNSQGSNDTPDSLRHRREMTMEEMQAASSPEVQPLSLSQRRGLAIRRLVIADSNRVRASRQTQPPEPQPTPFAVYRPAPEWRLRRRAADRAPEDAAGTMGEYRRAMEFKRRQQMGAGAPELQVLRAQAHTPSPRNTRELKLKILRRPSQGGQPAHAALPVRILVALLLYCKALLLLPITIVQALLSPTPPWCPRTPSGENRKWPIRRSSSLSPFGPPAFEALMEPFTP